MMALRHCDNLRTMEKFLDDCLVKLEDGRENHEDVVRIGTDIVNSIKSMTISDLCTSVLLGHKLFYELSSVYCKQVNLWCHGSVLSNRAKLFLSNFGSLFMQLSDSIAGTDVIALQTLIQMNLNNEFLSCLKTRSFRPDDLHFVCVGHLLYSLWRLEYHEFFVEDRLVKDHLITSIASFLCAPWYEKCLSNESNDTEKFIFGACLDYILDHSNEYLDYCCYTISSALLEKFSRWFHEQTQLLVMPGWDEQTIFILSKLISILTNIVYPYNCDIEDSDLIFYGKLIESIMVVLLKHAQYSNDLSQNRATLNCGVLLRNLTHMSLNPILENMIRKKNLSVLLIYLNQEENLNVQMYACQLLMMTMKRDDFYLKMDVGKAMATLLSTLLLDNGPLKHSYYSKQSLHVLEHTIQYEKFQKEFINQRGLYHALKLTKCYARGSFETREIAQKIIDTVLNKKSGKAVNRAYEVSQIDTKSVAQWVSRAWKLRNWSRDRDENHSSVMVTIPTKDFDPKKALNAVLKHNQLLDEERIRNAAQRNRECSTLIWIHRIEEKSNLQDTIVHLRLIVHNVIVYSNLEINDAIKFIFQNRDDSICLLIHSDVQENISSRIQHASHITSIHVYGTALSPHILFTKSDTPTLTWYDRNIYFAIDHLAENLHRSKNQTFWFYESKQTTSSDLSSESAAFLWKLTLMHMLDKVPSVVRDDLLNLAQQWYKGNHIVLCEIEEFRMRYDSNSTTDWILVNGSFFIQRLLEKAFKTKDMQILWAANFFISDLSKKFQTVSILNTKMKYVFMGELMQIKRLKFLLSNPDTLLIPKGFLVGCMNEKKTFCELKQRLRQQNSTYAIFITVEISDNCPILLLDPEHILFSLDTSFQIMSMKFDVSRTICKIQLRTVEYSQTRSRIVDRYKMLRQTAGEYMDENILFGSLLVDMNRVLFAMPYFSFQMDEYSDKSLLVAHRLATMGRAALKCDSCENAEQYYNQALCIYDELVSHDDLYFIRLLIDLGVVYIKRCDIAQAFRIFDRISLILTNESIPSLFIRYLAQCLMCYYQIASKNIVCGRQTLKILMKSYDELEFKCEHAAIIATLIIEIGDLASDQSQDYLSHECYSFAYQMTKTNLPLCHSLVMISLQRQLESQEKTAMDEVKTLLMMEQQMLPLLYNMLADINDDTNQKVADTMRQIGFQYVRYGSDERARWYIERCLSIYRRLWPLDYSSVMRCQAFIMKQNISDSLIERKLFDNIDDLYLSAMYECRNAEESEEAKEQKQVWDTAKRNFEYNKTFQSGVVRRTRLVWINTRKDTVDYNTFLESLRSNDAIEFYDCNTVDVAIAFLSTKSFEHIQIAVNSEAAEQFLIMQNSAQLQTTLCLTMCIFIFGVEHDEKLYAKYLPYLQCSRKCWSKMPHVSERCLVMSGSKDLLYQFCTIPDTLGLAIAHLMLLVDAKIFENVFDDEIDPLKHQVFVGSVETTTEFIGYMSCKDTTVPKLFQHLRVAKAVDISKNDMQIAALITFGRRHNLSTTQIASLCRHLSPGCCIKSETLIKYLVHLWSLESPPFYQYVNKALAQCVIDDVHLLRFILYDYFAIFHYRKLPYYVGTLYRGIHTTDDTVASLMSLVGNSIYFTCFTSTSKSLARAMVGGNVLFEITTLSREQQEDCRTQTNADISSVSQFPEEEEVIYAPLTTFFLWSITYTNDPSAEITYIVRIREQGSSIFSTLLLDNRRLPDGSPFRIDSDMWAYS